MQVIPLDALLVLLSLWGLAGVSNNNLEKCLRPNTESIQDKSWNRDRQLRPYITILIKLVTSKPSS